MHIPVGGVLVFVISWGPTCTNVGSHLLLTAPPKSPAHVPSALSLGVAGPAPVLVTLSSAPTCQSPRVEFLTGFFPTCTSGYCGTTAGGRVWDSPLSHSSPQARPCASLLLWKAWAPKVLYVFIVTLYYS